MSTHQYHNLKFLTLSDLEQNVRILQHHFIFQQQELANELTDLGVDFQSTIDKGIVVHVDTISDEQAERLDFLLKEQYEHTRRVVAHLNGEDENV